jgi:murein DD-endopeptidase MepM/ murein hydrolase activator NlpD
MQLLKIILLLSSLVLYSCAGKETTSFINKYDRKVPIEKLESQINTSTHSKYGHIILLFDLLNLNYKNNLHTYRESIQASNLYLYLISADVSKEKFLYLISMLQQKVIHKTINQQKFSKTLNDNATRKIKELTIFISELDQRLKIHKLKSNHQLVIAINKMARYLKKYSRELNSMSLKDKLEILRKINNALERIPLTNPLSQYKVTDRYRMRAGSFLKKEKMHSGIDLAASKSSDVFTSAAGIVKYAGGMNGYGNIVIIEHGKNISTCYAHLQKIAVRKGNYVLLGEKIGIQGSTGQSTGDHLHYEIRLSNKPINPDTIKRF